MIKIGFNPSKKYSGLIGCFLISSWILLGCGSSPSSSSPDDSIVKAIIEYSATSTTLDSEVVKTWPDKWCQAQPGISKSRLIEIMGNPTSDQSQGQSSWAAFEYMFNAFYDANGNVRQLDIMTSRLTSSQINSLECATTRKAQ